MPGYELSDFTIEVRDPYFQILGSIPTKDCELEWDGLYNNVGTWKLSIRGDHPAVKNLLRPYSTSESTDLGLQTFGNGIVVSVNGTPLFSGPMTTPSFEITSESLGSVMTFEGVTDEVVLADRVCFPQPSNPDPATQTLSHDIRTGAAESLMHGYLDSNAGVAAPPERRVLGLQRAAYPGRGATVRKSARFDNLGVLLDELARPNDLGFRLIQNRNKLIFSTYQTVNRTKEIRFNLADRSIIGQRGSISGPSATHVIVAGQGELTDRQFRLVTNSDQGSGWKRRIERFLDQRQTNVEEELVGAGRELIAAEGNTDYNIQVIPADDSTLRFGTDYNMGDKISVQVDQSPFPKLLELQITGIKLRVNADGVRFAMDLGNPANFQGDTERAIADVSSRIANLEKSDPGQSSTDWVYPALLNGWKAVGGYPPRYRTNRAGQVIIQGLVNAGTPNTTVFTLPSGLRPKDQTRSVRGSVYVHPGKQGVVEIKPTGEIQPGGQSDFTWYCIDLAPLDL